ncbi:hypothetical protein GCM10008101_08210 [Lysobacter xinjiangensis]|uniref:ORC1/DEAH AAA+ ATPase domain-containing protein n=1 Tax=Cognatilysobacter xinjiangensis TaxID=546892 RepID=A0ABQ3BU64_9GAMM|nr:ATP-binding protein [Lysobacter xinjiangensis]GGZ57060.1 hypothetical protein GCM10008101_08210 [Lysobacter xinjiangensis]
MKPIHPMGRNNDFLMMTRPIERLAQTFLQWILFNRPGGMVYGQRRRGKSRAIAWIRKYLKELLGYPIEVVHVCARQPKNEPYRVQHFFDNLLDALNEPTSSRETTSAKFTKIRNKLIVYARRCPARKVVIVIDDAQRLQKPHYEWLMSFLNEIEVKYRMQAVVFLVGQPELALIRELFVSSGELQLTGRFMPEAVEFVGHRSAEELRYSFDRIDQHLFWPRDSGISYTAYHAPEAVAANWGLALEADKFWDAWVATREAQKIPFPEDMSMQALTGIAYFTLVGFASQPGFTRLSETDIATIIEAQGYLEIEVSEETEAV